MAKTSENIYLRGVFSPKEEPIELTPNKLYLWLAVGIIPKRVGDLLIPANLQPNGLTSEYYSDEDGSEDLHVYRAHPAIELQINRASDGLAKAMARSFDKEASWKLLYGFTELIGMGRLPLRKTDLNRGRKGLIRRMGEVYKRVQNIQHEQSCSLDTAYAYDIGFRALERRQHSVPVVATN